MKPVNQQPILPSAKLAEYADASNPLSTSQLDQLAEAKKNIKPIFSAVTLATFNFWSFAFGAALSLLVVFFVPSGLVAAACLTLAAYNEYRGRRLLRELEPKGGLILIYNQLGFLVIIFLYCSWRIADCYLGPTLFDERAPSNSMILQLLSEDGISVSKRDLSAINDLYRTFATFFYLGVMALSTVIQGLCAWTYYRRYKVLKDFLQRTPKWVLAALKATS